MSIEHTALDNPMVLPALATISGRSRPPVRAAGEADEGVLVEGRVPPARVRRGVGDRGPRVGHGGAQERRREDGGAEDEAPRHRRKSQWRLCLWFCKRRKHCEKNEWFKTKECWCHCPSDLLYYCLSSEWTFPSRCASTVDRDSPCLREGKCCMKPEEVSPVYKRNVLLKGDQVAPIASHIHCVYAGIVI